MNKKHMIVRVASVHIANQKKQGSQFDQMIRVAAMNYEAGVKDSLKGMLLKYVVNPVDKFRRHLDLFIMPVDDLMDDVVEAIAPAYAEALMESEVDADVEEFEAGAVLSYRERTQSRYMEEVGKEAPLGMTPEFYEGYEWGATNRPPIPVEVKKRIIQEAAQEHDKKVVERALKKALNVINPWEIIKHAYHLIKKYGWDADADKQWYIKWPLRFFKVVLMGIAVAIVETLEHYVLPATMVKITGNPAWWGLASIPLLELIMPIVIAYFKSAKKDVVDEPGHLDWYEENYGEIEDALEDENAFRGRRAGKDLYVSKNKSQLKLFPHELQDLIKEISELTKWNAHTDAVVLLAENFGDRSDQDDANYVKTVHNAQGHMPSDVRDFRYKLLKKLLSKAKRVLPRTTYMKLHQAF
jgi:hypothetical protein